MRGWSDQGFVSGWDEKFLTGLGVWDIGASGTILRSIRCVTGLSQDVVGGILFVLGWRRAAGVLGGNHFFVFLARGSSGLMRWTHLVNYSV